MDTSTDTKKRPVDEATETETKPVSKKQKSIMRAFAASQSTHAGDVTGQRAREDEMFAAFSPLNITYVPSKRMVKKSDGKPFDTQPEWVMEGLFGAVQTQRWAVGVGRLPNGSLTLDQRRQDSLKTNLVVEKPREIRDFATGKLKRVQRELRRPVIGALYTAGGMHAEEFLTTKSTYDAKEKKFTVVRDAQGQSIPALSTVLKTRDLDIGAIHMNTPEALRTWMRTRIALEPFVFDPEQVEGRFANDFTFAIPFGADATALVNYGLEHRKKSDLTQIEVVHELGEKPERLFFFGEAHPAKVFATPPSEQWKFKPPGQQAEIPHYWVVKKRTSVDVAWDDATTETYAVRFLLRGEAAAMLLGGVAPFSWRYLAPLLFDPEKGMTGVGIGQLYITRSKTMQENHIKQDTDDDAGGGMVRFGALKEVMNEETEMDKLIDNINKSSKTSAAKSANVTLKSDFQEAGGEEVATANTGESGAPVDDMEVSAQEAHVVGGAHFAMKMAYCSAREVIEKYGIPISRNMAALIAQACETINQEANLVSEEWANKTYDEYSSLEMRNFQWLNSPSRVTSAMLNDEKNVLETTFVVWGPKLFEWLENEENEAKLEQWKTAAAEVARKHKETGVMPEAEYPGDQVVTDLANDNLLPKEALAALLERAKAPGNAQRQLQTAYMETKRDAILSQLSIFGLTEKKALEATEEKVIVNFAEGVPGRSPTVAEAQHDAEIVANAPNYMKEVMAKKREAAPSKPLTDAELYEAAIRAEQEAMKRTAPSDQAGDAGATGNAGQQEDEKMQDAPHVNIPGLDAPTLQEEAAPQPSGVKEEKTPESA